MFNTVVLEFGVIRAIVIVSMDMGCHLVVFDMNHLERIKKDE
jgi:hypothetical protein